MPGQMSQRRTDAVIVLVDALAPSIARDVQLTTSPTYDRSVGSSPLSVPEPREEGGSRTNADAVPTEVTVGWACREESTCVTSFTRCGSMIRFVRQFSRI